MHTLRKKFTAALAAVAMAAGLSVGAVAPAQADPLCGETCRQYCSQFYTKPSPEWQACVFECIEFNCHT